ncbi:MAG: hypothetical protein L6R39_003430 [Caloplaca ligustica]|nr:MAG: hypothetical protein L6R39_003430 [Caloplaca ligustica]
MLPILRLFSFISFIALHALANPACPNTLAFYNPNIRSTCYNATWFILPVPKSSVQALVQPYSLITPPFSDATLFPKGFPANSHPVLVATGYQNDIRMFNLQISSLMSGSIYIPYTDRLKDGKTPFNYPVQNYIGGVNGQDVQAAVPALVGTAEGTNIFVGSFAPNNDAYAPIASFPNEFSAEVKQILVPNTISGPSVLPEAFDFDFITTNSPMYTAHTFHALINQAIILTNGLCQRNPYYFNETFAAPTMRSGNVTLVGPLAGSVPSALAGKYFKQGGYSASGEMLGYNAETCASAAANSDPKAFR